MAEQFFNIENFGGINLTTSPSTIADNESPDMLNMYIDNNGMLLKRKGYTPAASLPSLIRSSYVYRAKDGKEVVLVATDTYVYRLVNDVTVAQKVGDITSPPGSNILFFAMNNLIYMLDGVRLYQFKDTTDPKFEAVVGYVPTVTMSMSPSGSGETFEDINIIDNAFKCSYSGDNTTKVYQVTKVTEGEMDGYVEVTVNGTVLGKTIKGGTAATAFTVDWANWKVTFTTAPTTGTNNVIIKTCYPATILTEHRSKVADCSLYTMFGGNNDTRVFLAGNTEYPNRIYRSGLLDPTYFPINGFYDIGTNDQPITAFAKQYDSLVILKTSSIYLMNFQVTNGEAVFSSMPLNDKVGCIAPRTIELLENSPVWLSEDGVYMLSQTEIRNERNVTPMSAKVDPKLRAELEKQNAIGVDYDNKYIVKVNDICYVFDYKLGIWYLWDNIPATEFYVINDKLFFSTNEGNFYRMYLAEGENEIGESRHYKDIEAPINCYWYSKEMDFGLSFFLKSVKKLFYTVVPGEVAGIKIYESYKDEGEELIHQAILDKAINPIAISKRVKLKAKKIQRYQIKISSENRIGELLALKNLGFEYLPIKYVKR